MDTNPTDRLAATLIAELSRGRRISPALHRLLAAELGPPDREATESERAIAQWVAATPAERGRALRDLLSVGDALPGRATDDGPRFPRFGSLP
jgi:hypothetical protein